MIASYDREGISWLGDIARPRNKVCVLYGMVVAEDCPMAEATAVLQSCFSLIVPAMRPLLSDLASYPFHLYCQFAKKFPVVRRADLEKTVEKLVECHARCACRDVTDPG